MLHWKNFGSFTLCNLALSVGSAYGAIRVLLYTTADVLQTRLIHKDLFLVINARKVQAILFMW